MSKKKKTQGPSSDLFRLDIERIGDAMKMEGGNVEVTAADPQCVKLKITGSYQSSPGLFVIENEVLRPLVTKHFSSETEVVLVRFDS